LNVRYDVAKKLAYFVEYLRICCRNEGKLILCAFVSRSADGSMVLVRYYLLGGDTAASSGLYARFCHAFLVSFFYSSSSLMISRLLETNYLSIRWTDFLNIFTE